MLQVDNLEVLSISDKGLGIIKYLEKNYFVRYTLPGDIVSIILKENQAKNSEVKLLKILKESNKRIPSVCPHVKECGGCPLIELDYEEQLILKREKLIHKLHRKKIEIHSDKIGEVSPSPKKFAYRNRGQFKVNKNQVGYVNPVTNEIVDIKNCQILTFKNQNFLNDLRTSLPNEAFNPPKPHRWQYLDFDEENDIKNFKLNKRRPFSQGNSEQNIFMKEWLRAKIQNLNREIRALELFSGSGNFTEVIALQAKTVIACEVEGSALEKLREHNFDNVKVVAIDLFKSNCWKTLESMLPSVNVLVLDPPREGIKYQRAWINVLPDLSDIFYISCEIDSFVRDIKEFIKLGFELLEIKPVDQFPHTVHLEVLAHLRRITT